MTQNKTVPAIAGGARTAAEARPDADELRKAADIDLDNPSGPPKPPPKQEAAEETPDLSVTPLCLHCGRPAKVEIATMTFTNGIAALIFYCHFCKRMLPVTPVAQMQPQINPTRKH